MNLKPFFNPNSVAVIGASSDKNKVGYAIMANLLAISEVKPPNGGFTSAMPSEVSPPRTIYPVSLSEKEIMGHATYSSVKDIREPIDLAVIAVRADFVPQILADCGTKKIPAAIIIAAGFREVGHGGKILEEKCAAIAKENNIALLGPNCLGTIDANSGFNASFAARSPKKGHIAFLSQSGALGTSILDMAEREGVGFSKFISLGNEADLSEIEFLEFLADDSDTRSILIYLEKLSNGPEFMRLCSQITKTKPIVVLKAGRSAGGSRAVASHTGSLAPDDAIFSAALQQSGVIAVESIREFFNIAKLFELGITKPLERITILTNGGGPSVVTADLVDLSHSLSLTEFRDDTKESLKKVLPVMAAVGNPVDIIGDALSARYRSALEILVEAPDCDAIILILTPQMMTEAVLTADLIKEFLHKKPIIPVFLGGPSIEEGVRSLLKHGLVNFNFPKDAVEALDDLASVSEKVRNKIDVGDESRKSHKSIQGQAINMTASSTPPILKMMSFGKMIEILGKYGIVLNGFLLKDRREIVKAVSKLGKGPYVLKAISPDIIHKTDAGVVYLDLKSIEEVEKAWDGIMREIDTKFSRSILEGLFLQTMSRGKEVIIGMKRDPIFGAAILFGLGGIFTEALKDTSMRIAPISLDMAMDMIHEIKGKAILTGLRGEKSVDLDSLAELIVKMSNLAIHHPEVKEIDLNPVVATANGALVVDARMMLD